MPQATQPARSTVCHLMDTVMADVAATMEDVTEETKVRGTFCHLTHP